MRPLTRLARWAKGSPDRFQTWRTTPVTATKGRIWVSRIVLVIAFTIVYGLVHRYDANQREAIAREAMERDFATRQQQYIFDKTNFDNCVASIPTFATLRTQFEQDAARWDGLAAIATNPDLKVFAQQWADDIRAGAFLATRPKTLADCGLQPVPPPPLTE